MFKYFLFRLTYSLVNFLPLKVSYAIAQTISDIQFAFSRIDKQSIHNNLQKIVASGEPSLQQSREVLRNFGKYLIEFFRMERHLDQDYIRENIDLENVDIIQSVLDKGRGGIIMTAHIGNWELGASVLSHLGFPVMAVALPHQQRDVNDFFNRQRESQGNIVVQSNVAVKRCVKRLRDNKLVALVADRDFTENGEELDFFGQKTLIPKGTAMFSLKTGAAIIPTFLIRNGFNKFVLKIQEPIYPPIIDDKMDERHAILKIMKKHTEIIENIIRQYPSQWLMFREFGV